MVHKTDFVKNQAKDFSRQIWAVCNYTISKPESGFMQNCTNWESHLLLGVKRNLKFTRVK